MPLTSFLTRVFSFVKRYHQHPLFVLAYGLTYPRSKASADVHFFLPEEFVQEIHKGRSFLRFGDGEIHIMNGGSLPSQTFDLKLSQAMRKMTKEYSDKSPYIIGFSKFVNKTNSELQEKNLFYGWLPAKVLYKIFFPKKVLYGDAHFFYYDGFFKKYLEDYLMDKHIVVVSNEDNVHSLKNNTSVPFKKISYVVTPKKDSYQKYDAICQGIDTVLSEIPKDEKPVLVIAAGPTSKHLVYTFSMKGVTSLDIGTGLEVLYKNKSMEDLFPMLKKQ